MSNFTPGPWIISDDRWNNPEHDDKCCSIVNAEWVIAEVCGDINEDADGEPEGHANANLIAAAPEMYEALKSYASCSDGCTCGDGWSHDAAIEALLKAEGRQP